MSKFKVGDMVVNNGKGNYSLTNEKAGIMEVVEIGRDSYGDIKVKILQHQTKPNKNGQTFPVNSQYFDLAKKGKMVKSKPIVKHVVIVDSCQNFDGIFNSFEEAKDRVKQNCSESKTIYKLVPMAKCERVTKVTKVNPKTSTKKKK